MIIIADKYGQLGNRLWLFGHFIAFSIEHGASILNPAFDEYAAFFEGTRANALCRFPQPKRSSGRLRVIRKIAFRLANLAVKVLSRIPLTRGPLQALTLWDEYDFLDLGSWEFKRRALGHRILLVRGWMFRDQKSFEKHRSSVKRFFEPVEEHRRNIADLIERARRDCDALIGVHIRQGDIAQWKAGDYLFSSKEYSELMARVATSFGNLRVGFLVSSNTKQEKAIFNGLEVTLGTGDAVEDMYALAACDYIVGPPSTYSMWASFYGDVPLHILRDPKDPVELDQATTCIRDFAFVETEIR